MQNLLKIEESSPTDKEVLPLLEALSENLLQRFGSSGKNSFQDWQFEDSRHIFLKATLEGETVGCGAIRPLSSKVGEIKRMFAKYSRKSIGKTILQSLEVKAKTLGFEELWLETRVANKEACNFYRQNGYQKIENFGKYVGRSEAVCFGKKL